MSKRITYRQHTVNTSKSGQDDLVDSPARTPEGDAFSALVVQIFRLNGLLLAAGDALVAPTGQTSARWRVLSAVEDSPLSVAQIAHNWGLARQSVQRVADVLVREGLAVYEKNPHHRRAQLLVLTPRGLSALHVMQAAQRNWANALGAQFDEADLRQAVEVLSRLLEVVSKQEVS